MRNYKPYPSREDHIRKLHQSWKSAERDDADQVAQSRKSSNKKIRDIDNSMQKALKGSRSQVGRYCIDMLEAKQSETRRKRMDAFLR